MTAGIELIKKKTSILKHGAPIAITTPLLTTQGGLKIGKSLNNGSWLSAEKTSPLKLFKSICDFSDSIVLILAHAVFDEDGLLGLIQEHDSCPRSMQLQRQVAYKVVSLVHSIEFAEGCDLLFKELNSSSYISDEIADKFPSDLIRICPNDLNLKQFVRMCFNDLSTGEFLFLGEIRNAMRNRGFTVDNTPVNSFNEFDKIFSTGCFHRLRIGKRIALIRRD